VGAETTRAFAEAFPTRGKGWKAIALTGRRAPLLVDLVEACRISLGWSKDKAGEAVRDDRAFIAMLEAEAETRSGLLIILDELGKSFEHAVAEGGDIHILQDLAERASRSDGRIVLIGILHQSFDQYADRLSRGSREEWAKVQGRFQNIPFVAQADEVAALLAHAIESTPPPGAADLADAVAKAVSAGRCGVSGRDPDKGLASPSHNDTSTRSGLSPALRSKRTQRLWFPVVIGAPWLPVPPGDDRD